MIVLCFALLFSFAFCDTNDQGYKTDGYEITCFANRQDCRDKKNQIVQRKTQPSDNFCFDGTFFRAYSRRGEYYGEVNVCDDLNCTENCRAVRDIESVFIMYLCFSSGIVDYPICRMDGQPCFSSNSLVITDDGDHIPLNEVSINQKVMSISSDNEVHYSTVVDVLHHGYEAKILQIHYTTTDGDSSKLMITPNHYLFFTSTEDGDVEIEDIMSKGFGLAKDVKEMDRIVVFEDESFKIAQVTEIEVTSEEVSTIYTSNGKVVVDGTVASIYSLMMNEDSETSMVPLWFREWYQHSLQKLYVNILKFGLNYLNWEMKFFKSAVLFAFDNFFSLYG